jgi:hypothetical protein
MKYFVFCPVCVTGGPEALHQLCSELNDLGFDSYMFYYYWCNLRSIDYIMPEYSHYNVKISPYSNLNELDDENFTIIVPEIFARNTFSSNFKAKVVYWFLACSSNYEDPFLEKYYLGCQSEESYERILNSNYPNKNKVFRLTDYTRQNFVCEETDISNKKRNGIVLYNPRKGSQHTQNIISTFKNLYSEVNCEFIAIENMSIEDVKKIGLNSKIYIDFGHHPGKDRLPREMATLGCFIIVGNQCVAKNEIDLPIKNKKFEYCESTDSYQYEQIAQEIKNVLENYESLIDTQKHYRNVIRNEKTVFINEIKNMVDILSQK